jgi:hypothetical protein
MGVNALALRRLLRGLVNRGLVTEARADTFSLTALGKCLRSDAPGGLGTDLFSYLAANPEANNFI